MEKMKSWLLFLPLVRCDVLWSGFFDANFTVDHFDNCTPLILSTLILILILTMQGPGPTKSPRTNGTSTARSPHRTT